MFRVMVLSVAWLALVGVPAAVAGEAAEPAEAMSFIGIAEDGRRFVEVESGRAFHPWGFNYDHHDELDGALLEDYWHDDWALVVEDFKKMKALGANVVRIHLQFGRFMNSATEPNEASLDQLRRLLRLAEDVGLYVNLTGLGCYHKPDVPEWYDAMTERERWDAQARFWEAVAEVAADSPAVFCYDLMNEPVVPGGDKRRDDWLGPPFADTGKHFVQFITLDRAGRERPAIARAWVAKLVDAIRKHDERHLVTVGLVPWSLDRPGLTSGFEPAAIAEELDFISVHLYPETGKLDEAIETLKGFDVGLPVVIEETYPLRCTIEEFDAFLERSRETATGWFGFFWGQSPADLDPPQTLGDAIIRQWLLYFEEKAPAFKEG